ncbi:hypothetical protein DEJ49_33225 [Streptomyces venezuelae]|uniref:Uncharacterized protein n=1 Tax=Streptomyces venezuelae TaxID=54571 RepID=A0A5P2CS21_STRVZ|nr:hypothetical protein [Streptomyces venezuelae]QES45203.1 hypothetical protein DEJ49_33225 [Streptomyces venezuelae]
MTVLLSIALLAALAYGLRCWLSPFGACRRCHGLGYRLRTSRSGRPRRGKPCRRCRASGLRLRVGRRLTNYARGIHRDGTR